MSTVKNYARTNAMMSVEERKAKMDAFFTGIDCPEVDELVKANKKLAAQMKANESKISDAYSKKYASSYEPLDIEVVFKYTDRKRNDYYFNSNGVKVEEFLLELMEKKVVYDLNYLDGVVEYPVGYCFELGSVVKRSSEYKLDAKKTSMKITNSHETLIDMLPITDQSYWFSNSLLRDIPAKYFIEKYFGDPAYADGINKFSLAEFKSAYRNNKALEVIIKTADAEVKELLLRKRFDAPKAVWGLLGLENAQEYTELKNDGILIEFLKLRDEVRWIERVKAKDLKALIKRAADDQEELLSNNINCAATWYGSGNPEMLKAIVGFYCENELIYNNFSIGKYYKYVVAQVVEQMYDSVRNFMTEHRDYIAQAKKMGAPCVLYTNDVTRSHKVATRNYNACFTAEQEAAFKEKYNGFKPWVGNGYTVVCPQSTQDMKMEGTALNHCSYSYVPKVIKGICEVLFLRKEDTPDKSLITMEIRENELVQVAGYANRQASDEEMKAVKAYCKKAGIACGEEE